MGRIILPGQLEPEPELEPEEVEPAPFTVEAMQRWAIATHRTLAKVMPPGHVQAEAELAIKQHIVAGDPRIAIGFLMVLIARQVGDTSGLESFLNDMAWSLEAHGLPVRQCRFCECTNTSPCVGGCWWIDWDVCSACEHKVAETAAAAAGEGAPSDG